MSTVYCGLSLEIDEIAVSANEDTTNTKTEITMPNDAMNHCADTMTAATVATKLNRARMVLTSRKIPPDHLFAVSPKAVKNLETNNLNCSLSQLLFIINYLFL